MQVYYALSTLSLDIHTHYLLSVYMYMCACVCARERVCSICIIDYENITSQLQ